MHSSLTIRTNVLLMGLYGAALIACTAFSPPSRPLLLVPFATGGVVAGLLQAKAISVNPAMFRAAQSWATVRNALASSASGKLSLSLLWLNGLALLGLIYWGSGIATPSTVIGAYASFGFARELATFRSVRILNMAPGTNSKNSA